MLHRFDPFSELASRRGLLDADIYRIDDTFYLEIDAPGVVIEDIDLQVEKKNLTVSIERRETSDDRRTQVVQGRPTGRFVRTFFLGDSLDAESISAEFENGVLTLRIPVNEKAKARKIEVNAGSPAIESEVG